MGIVLLFVPRRGLFLVSEVPLWGYRPSRLRFGAESRGREGFRVWDLRVDEHDKVAALDAVRFEPFCEHPGVVPELAAGV